MRQLLSDIEKLGCGCHTRAPKPISVSCVYRSAEVRNKYFLRSDVNWCNQTCIDLHLRRSTCLASRIRTKINISEVRVHAGALFEHPGWWSIAKCSRRFTKFSWSFNHHGKSEKEMLKNCFEKWNKTNLKVLGDLWEKLMKMLSTTNAMVPL